MEWYSLAFQPSTYLFPDPNLVVVNRLAHRIRPEKAVGSTDALIHGSRIKDLIVERVRVPRTSILYRKKAPCLFFGALLLWAQLPEGIQDVLFDNILHEPPITPFVPEKSIQEACTNSNEVFLDAAEEFPETPHGARKKEVFIIVLTSIICVALIRPELASEVYQFL